VIRTAISQIIPGYAGDHGMGQVEGLDGLGNSAWLIGINGKGFPRSHVAVATISRAAITQDHEGGCFGGKTFIPVWAVGLHADGADPVFLKEGTGALVGTAVKATQSDVRFVTARTAVIGYLGHGAL